MAYMTFTDALMNAKRASRMRGTPFSTRDTMNVQSSYMGLGGGAERASARMSSASDQKSLAAQKQNFADTLAEQKSQFEQQQSDWTRQRETALTQQRDLQAQWLAQQQTLAAQQPALGDGGGGGYGVPFQAPSQGPGSDMPMTGNNLAPVDPYRYVYEHPYGTVTPVSMVPNVPVAQPAYSGPITNAPSSVPDIPAATLGMPSGPVSGSGMGMNLSTISDDQLIRMIQVGVNANAAWEEYNRRGIGSISQ